MCSKQDGTNVPTQPSSPPIAASPVSGGHPPGEPPQPPAPAAPANAFAGPFLDCLNEREEPAAAEEAEWAGPWRLDHLMGGGLGLFRMGESEARGHLPFARFQSQPDALMALAIMMSRRETAYRLQALGDGRGYAVQSRAAWGDAVGWLAVFDDDLAARLSWAEDLQRSPQALALFLESCGKVILERAGAILEERVRPADR